MQTEYYAHRLDKSAKRRFTTEFLFMFNVVTNNSLFIESKMFGDFYYTRYKLLSLVQFIRSPNKMVVKANNRPSTHFP